MRDDIISAMKRGEVTLAIMADFSKAFDTVAFETVLNTLQKHYFSKSFLKLGHQLLNWSQAIRPNRRQRIPKDRRCLWRSSRFDFGPSSVQLLCQRLYVNV